MKNVFLIIMLIISASGSAQKKYYMLVGTYTNGRSKGIYVYDYNMSEGSATLVDSVVTSNPSYLAISPDRNTVYAVNEEGGNGDGRVTSFSFDRSTGNLKELSTTKSMGDHPCYVAVDKTGKWVTAGNYSSGSAALLSVDKNGELWLKGSMGFNKSMDSTAKKSHIHATVFSKDNKYVFMPDLGMDKIWVWKFDEKKGILTAPHDSYVSLPDSSGPRHLVFHPSGKWAYLVQELSGTVTAFNYKDGQLKKIQSLSTLSKDFQGPARSADIHVSQDGKFLYASNRDPSNNIAIYKINGQTGMLTLVGHQPTLGKTPRNFNFDPSGNYLFAANQNSNNIVVFRVDHTTGLLKDTGNRIDVGNPVCVKWVER
ncbi:MAG: lactonase family protein [Flavisolibacter sp.]